MRARVLIFFAGLALGCQSAPPPKPVPPEVSEEAKLALAARCRERCEHDRQMQAMAAEAIAAGCQIDCERRVSAPLVTNSTELGAQAGAEVRVAGRLESGEGGLVLVLGEARVPIESPEAVEELEQERGREVLFFATVLAAPGGFVLTQASCLTRRR